MYRNRAAPTSCQSCRSKKLRCNRTQPCSNCTSRSVACEFLVPPQRHTESSHLHNRQRLLERLERLESLVSSDRISTCNGGGDEGAEGGPPIASPHVVEPSVYEPGDACLRMLEHVATQDYMDVRLHLTVYPSRNQYMLIMTSHPSRKD